MSVGVGDKKLSKNSGGGGYHEIYFYVTL